LPVATTTNTVMAGCSRISQRHRLVLRVITAQATSTAHATCTDGIADSWSAPAVEPSAT
jgi:Tfp pilus assembly protein PilW